MMRDGTKCGRMTGQLQEHPLAELLHEISADALSGALRLEQERLKTVVYLADGEIIYASSNLRQHRLSECIRRWRVLNEQELSALPAEDASDWEVAAALIEGQALDHAALESVQARQVTEVLRAPLLWTTGSWEFDARVRMNRDVRVSIDVKTLLAEGARRLPQEFVASRFSNMDEQLSPVENPPAGFELLPKEAFVLSRLDAPLALAELIAISALPEMEVWQIIYTLALGGLIKRGQWMRAFSPEMLARARSVKTTTTKGQARPALSNAPPEIKQEASPAAAPAAPVKTEADEGIELDALFARLSSAEDYYQVLGVRRTATAGDIKGSYHKLAKRFHPDRFYNDADTTLHARVEVAFARIAQAYETLKEKQSRAVYDLRLTQQAASAIAPQQARVASEPGGAQREGTLDEAAETQASLLRQAENSFQHGQLALKQGKPRVAIASFSEAARLMPREARYRAFHGRALAENEGTWRQAEAEMKAAISLDSRNAGYYVMLAEFYLKIRLPRRAQSEVERALAIDSQNAAARQLLANLQATLKGQR
jgi:curved DNA-binding protein CbpA